MPEKPAQAAAWLFWDLWHLDRAESLALRQGRAEWRLEATYVADMDGLAAWPTVYCHEPTGRWRMFYTSRWKPYTCNPSDPNISGSSRHSPPAKLAPRSRPRRVQPRLRTRQYRAGATAGRASSREGADRE